MLLPDREPVTTRRLILFKLFNRNRLEGSMLVQPPPRRFWRDLLADGRRCGLHRIEQLMRLQGL